MKLKIFLVLVGVLVSAVFSYSGIADTTTDLSTLNVSGSGTIKTKPDVADLSFGVVTKGKTANEAIRQNATSAQKLIDTLMRAGILEKDIQTSSISVTPLYKRTSQLDNADNIIVGYEANNFLNATIRKVQDVGNIIDLVVSTGDYTINNINFSLDKRSAFEEEALRKAVADARLTAEIVASAASKTISGIKNISVNSSGPIGSGGFAASADKSATTPILPGDLTVSESVSIEFIFNK